MRLLGDYFLFSDPARLLFVVSAFSYGVFFFLLSVASNFFFVAAFSFAVFLLSVFLSVSILFSFVAAFSASVFLLSVLLSVSILFFFDAAFSGAVLLLSVSFTFFTHAAFFLFFSPRVPTPGAFFDWPVTLQYCCPSLILSENHAAISGVISSRRPSSLNFAKSVSKVPAGPPKCTNKSAMPRMKRSVSHCVDLMDVAKHM